MASNAEVRFTEDSTLRRQIYRSHRHVYWFDYEIFAERKESSFPAMFIISYLSVMEKFGE